MKKLITLVLCSALLSGFAFGQEETDFSLEFSNELGTEIVEITDDDSTFPGFYDFMKVGFDSEKVWAGVEAKGCFTTDSNGDPYSLSYNIDKFDWWIGFRPLNILELSYSENYSTDGAYLPVEDDYLVNGCLGSDGFTVAVKPIENLMLSVTAPFGLDDENIFKFEQADDEEDPDSDTTTKYFNFGFGAEYALNEKLKFSTTLKNVCNSDDIGFGVFAFASPVEGLALNCGYAYRSEGLCDVEGDNLYLFAAQYSNDKLAVAADFLSSHDGLYTAADFCFNVTDLLTPGAQFTLNKVFDEDDYDDGEKWNLVMKPYLVLNINENNEVKIEVDISVSDDGYESTTFPVYWKYYF